MLGVAKFVSVPPFPRSNSILTPLSSSSRRAMTAFLSGEMRDTVEVNPAASYMLEKMFSRKERAGLFQGWAGSASMWIKGGDSIWGDSEMAPDDPTNATDTRSSFLPLLPLW